MLYFENMSQISNNLTTYELSFLINTEAACQLLFFA